MQRILLIGHGAREHALLEKLRQDSPAAAFFITRGNAGTAHLATHIPLDPSDGPELAQWADANGIELAVVGPEAPLADGIAEHFARRGVPLFGPSRDAAAIEASKAYAKGLMRRAGVPTARFETFTDRAAAERYIRQHAAARVVKASGLAAGKGVIVCDAADDAVDAVHSMLERRTFGEAGLEVVVEDRLEGEELSYFCLTDGRDAALMIAAQDHKRIGEGDTGPNTGGMGAYAPVSLADERLDDAVRRDILEPTLEAMREDRRPFRGLLYAGLMITENGPHVIEFNARFGDPETQALLPLLRSSLLEPMIAIARGGSIAGLEFAWRDAAALTTVLATAGYPGSARRGDEVRIPAELNADDDIHVFHAGTKEEEGRVVTAGGRVMAVTGTGATLHEAARRSRTAAEAITFDGKQYRRDIGFREMERAAEGAADARAARG